MKEYKVYVNGKRIRDIGISSPKSTLRAKDKEHALQEAKKRLTRHEIIGKITVKE